VGFTSIGEKLSAQQLAEFLNRHFAMLAACIEAEGGTIDKYIGDSVMAFWGAPEIQPDHALRACRAVRAMAEVLGADNRRRQAKGLHPVRLRVGIHTGPAIAGNIGAPGRINYTLIGDTVNVSQRLEQLGKRFDTGEGDLIALISARTAAELPPELAAQPLGAHELRGRGEGRGEGRSAGSTLTLPSLRDGPLPLPPSRARGSSGSPRPGGGGATGGACPARDARSGAPAPC
jgi:class 3 adenylate cyclase